MTTNNKTVARYQEMLITSGNPELLWIVALPSPSYGTTVQAFVVEADQDTSGKMPSMTPPIRTLNSPWTIHGKQTASSDGAHKGKKQTLTTVADR